MFTRSMMRPFEEQGQKDTETEGERERKRERERFKKRCASSLAECQVVRSISSVPCAPFISQRNRMAAQHRAFCDNGLRDVTTCVAFTRPPFPPLPSLVATYHAIGWRRMGLPLSRQPLYNKQIKQRTIIDPPSSSWVSWVLEHPPVILVAREPLTRNHDT